MHFDDSTDAPSRLHSSFAANNTAQDLCFHTVICIYMHPRASATVFFSPLKLTDDYLCFFSHSSRDIALSGSILLPWRPELSDCNAGPVIDWNWLAASSSFFWKDAVLSTCDCVGRPQ